jgi:hypothetical protein
MLKTCHQASSHQKKKSATQTDYERFLSHLGKTIHSCVPHDICLYLAWKDGQGKTPVHVSLCPSIADRIPSCACPRRLAFGTVAGKISHLKLIFQKLGLLEPWDELKESGTIRRSLNLPLCFLGVTGPMMRGLC